MLTKSQMIDALVAEGAGDRKHVGNMLRALEAVGVAELQKGEDFVIPGLAKLHYTYRQPKKKGERWKKGDEVTGFGGLTTTKEEDSPPVTAMVKLKASPTGAVARNKPKSGKVEQAAFLKSKAGKAVIARKG